MNDNAKLLSTLGLCVKAGKVIFGVPMICDAMRKGTKNAPVLVLEASDTSENTHKKLTDKCTYYKTRLIRLDIGGEQLAAAVGKSAHIGAVALTDTGLGALVEKYI
jgi:ribosomal protein L7Ae-like RNA K-turn-binding protein